MIKDDNYITVLGFMVNKLKLKGNELLVYAIIFGFSQLKNQRFTGSLQYLADWTNSTKQGIQKNLKSLMEKGLIAKEDKIFNNVKFVEYYTTELHRVYNSVAGGIQHSCTNNIYIEEEKEEELKVDIKEEENPFTFYENNFGLLSTYIAENINTYLVDGLSGDLIIAAMKEAVDNNARKWNYVKTILNDCINEKITTVEQYRAKQIEFKNKKANKTTPTKKEVTYNTDFSEYDSYARRN